MAAAFFNSAADRSRAKGVSAGTAPGERVHPEVIAAMNEVGVDLSLARPQLLTPELGEHAAFLVTMGCGEACPNVPGVKRVDWPLEDPKGKPLERVRAIRDEIRARVAQLVVEKGWSASPTIERVSEAAQEAGEVAGLEPVEDLLPAALAHEDAGPSEDVEVARDRREPDRAPCGDLADVAHRTGLRELAQDGEAVRITERLEQPRGEDVPKPPPRG
jgi:arsenate reductase